MPTIALESEEAKRIDLALQEWRQGDLALEERWFVHVGDPSVPLTFASGEGGDAGAQALTSDVFGLAVVTQTCDIIRPCVARPYVEVAPLVVLGAEDIVTVQRGRRPGLATLPAIVAANLAVDLDRVMTIEKSIVSKWTRTPGYTRDADGRAFAQALSRKRVRVAFPDDFTQFAKKLQERLTGKHDKHSPEGAALRSLYEIRVQAAPSWEADAVTLFFWFVRNEADDMFAGIDWISHLKGWLKLVPAGGRFIEVQGQVATLGDMTGRDYVASDPLDLDHLSSRDQSPTKHFT